MENRVLVSEAFSSQSIHFDQTYQENAMVEYLRKRIRKQVLQHHKVGSLLELNAGTGTDAIFFAQQGFQVHATDNALGMLSQLEQKLTSFTPSLPITVERCNFEQIQSVSFAPFDNIYSNFGGLNCTDKLYDIVEQCYTLLTPQGCMTMVIMPPHSPWEWLELLRGKPKLAFRRYKKQVNTHLEGQYFTTYYYRAKPLIRHFKDKFEVLALQGLCSLMPPSYKLKLIKKMPWFWKSLGKIEEKIAHLPPFRNMADYYVLTLQKK